VRTSSTQGREKGRGVNTREGTSLQTRVYFSRKGRLRKTQGNTETRARVRVYLLSSERREREAMGGGVTKNRTNRSMFRKRKRSQWVELKLGLFLLSGRGNVGTEGGRHVQGKRSESKCRERGGDLGKRVAENFDSSEFVPSGAAERHHLSRGKGEGEEGHTKKKGGSVDATSKEVAGSRDQFGHYVTSNVMWSSGKSQDLGIFEPHLGEQRRTLGGSLFCREGGVLHRDEDVCRLWKRSLEKKQRRGGGSPDEGELQSNPTKFAVTDRTEAAQKNAVP